MKNKNLKIDSPKFDFTNGVHFISNEQLNNNDFLPMTHIGKVFHVKTRSKGKIKNIIEHLSNTLLKNGEVFIAGLNEPDRYLLHFKSLGINVIAERKEPELMRGTSPDEIRWSKSGFIFRRM